MKNLDVIKSLFEDKIHSITNKHDLLSLKSEFLGKNGLITAEIKKLSTIDSSLKKEIGLNINKIRDFISNELNNKQQILENEEIERSLNQQEIDITLPGRTIHYGGKHPIIQTTQEIERILKFMGFVTIDGPEIEDDWHNFTALNIPEIHPARQSHDTFYMQNHNALLRTHTSSVEIRHMKNSTPPIKILSIGKVYRADYDATHSPMFHQAEGLFVSTDVTVSHLKSCLTNLLKSFFNFNDSSAIRFRSSYFPFTVPSFEVDIKCDRSDKNSLKIGSGNDWLEILGCGMLHPKVLENCSIDPIKYNGFAFGIGIERLTMLKYQISDLRKFFECDIRWLNFFKN